jgi:hypothetical protein
VYNLVFACLSLLCLFKSSAASFTAVMVKMKMSGAHVVTEGMVKNSFSLDDEMNSTWIYW